MAAKRVGMLALLGAALGLTALAEPAAGQRYQPSRPTVSPYLDLLRQNNSPVPNYYSLVRPKQRQYEFNRQQQNALERNSRAIQELSYGLPSSTQPLNVSPGQFFYSGSGSQFLGDNGYFSGIASPRLGGGNRPR
ncbi:hypothetical protein [Pseudobythopirellula maris]|nr:hypothetical protein [Pseudobythopirellula maris]